jgi:hypothetical protein
MLHGRHDRKSDPVILNHGAQFMRSERDRQSNYQRHRDERTRRDPGIRRNGMANVTVQIPGRQDENGNRQSSEATLSKNE